MVNQLKVKVCGVAFASHAAWADGYAVASTRHTVDVVAIKPDRWKWRMQCSSIEFADRVEGADVVLVDGMLDVSALAAELRRSVHPPKVVVYMHENQLTTPFVTGDRDVANKTHWHYGAANWRTLLCADAVLFNSSSHLRQFAAALPAMINQQSPRDTVKWQLERAALLLKERCAVLHYVRSTHLSATYAYTTLHPHAHPHNPRPALPAKVALHLLGACGCPMGVDVVRHLLCATLYCTGS